MIKEENPSVKSKRKKPTDKLKGKTKLQSKDKAKAATKPVATNQAKTKKVTSVNVKIEGEKPEAKEGESLLDLLELEMRARAIRALIRKEEDIIPDKNSGSTSATKNNSTTNTNASTSKYVVQEMQQISLALKQGSGLDDDVMLVIQPAPTIELLSSESENEKEKNEDEEKGEAAKNLEKEKSAKEDQQKKKSNTEENEKADSSKRINKRLENERGTETTHSTSTIGDEPTEILDDDLKPEETNNSEKNPPEINLIEKSSKLKISSENNEEDNQSTSTDKNSPKKRTESGTISPQIKSATTLKEIKIEPKEKTDNSQNKNLKPNKEENTETREKSPLKELEDGELASESDSIEETEVVTRKGTNKRFRKRRRRKMSESSQKDEENTEKSEIIKSEDNRLKNIENSVIDDKISENSEEVEKSASKNERKISEEFDKNDMDEIIDLDDYPDDMDDLDSTQMNSTTEHLKKSKNVENGKSAESIKNTENVDNSKSDEKNETTETWASRYYNTDDVQNVIKESKIQSEIRKRLRERQRLSKLNNSPSTSKLENNSLTDNKIEEEQQKPLGLVEEYLALKAATASAVEPSANQKSSTGEKNKKSHRKRDKTKIHISKQKSRSIDKNLSKNGESKKTLSSKPD